MAKAKTTRKKAAPRKRAPRKSSVKRVSGFNKLLQALPFTEKQIQRGATWGVLLALGVVGYGVAEFFGAPAMAKQEFAHAASRAGFEVKHITVRGADKVNRLKVYEIVLTEKDRAMPLVDVEKLRSDLMEFGWIQDARVSRQLPDTLIVDIVERVPHAAWNNDGKLLLIDKSGIVLGKVTQAQAREFPLITGHRANERAEDLTALLEEAPALIPMVRKAEWIGNRRWNISFKSGETLALPEGKESAAAAWINFARMDGINRLLGKGVTYFDLRDPERAYLRMPRKKKEEAETKQSDKSKSEPEKEDTARQVTTQQGMQA